MSLLDQPTNTGSAGEPPKKPAGLANLLPFTTVALVLALLYVAWTFYSRSQTAKEAQAAALKQQEEANKKSADLIFGNGNVKFLVFTAGAHVKRGQSTSLCYGMVNAVKVSIVPDIGEQPKPTARHCVDISPKATTTYTITATNEKGQANTASLTIRVD